MNLQCNILSGSLTSAVSNNAYKRLPKSFKSRDFSLTQYAQEEGNFDYAKLHDVENAIIKKAQE